MSIANKTVSGKALGVAMSNMDFEALTADSITATNAAFSAMTLAGVTYTVGTAALTGGTMNGTAIDNSVIGASTAVAGTFTALTATSAHLGALEGTPIGAATAAAGTFTVLAATTGRFTAMEATVIGAATAAAGTFTVLTGTATAVIGASSTALVGFHGKTPVSAAASIVPVGATQGAIGFDTTAHASAAIDSINAIITAIKNIGITI